MPSKLSAKERLEVVKKALEGGNITNICREYGISRTLLYRWIKRFKEQSKSKPKLHEKDGLKSVEAKKARIYSSRIPKEYIDEVAILVRLYPNWGVGQIVKNLPRNENGKPIISYHGVQNILANLRLEVANERKEIKENQQSSGQSDSKKASEEKIDAETQILELAFENITPQDRLDMIERVKAGNNVSFVCKQFGVSRTIFYRWLKRYEEAAEGQKLEALWDKKPHIETYYRQASEEYEQAVLSAVREYPELSTHKLVWVLPQIGGKPILGNHGVQNVLRRNNLSTFEQRLAFAQAFHKPTFGTRFFGVFQKMLNFVGSQEPTKRKATVIASFGGVGLLFGLISLYGGYSLISLLVSSPSVAFSIGILFSLVSLTFGLFFFLYSMKYYITIAMVLSFSRNIAEGEKGIKRGSFFSKILSGYQNDPDEAKQRSYGHAVYLPGTGLRSDLSDVTLDRKPFVSIQLATYNEKRVVDRLLTAATAMDYENYEVILADDSTDETAQILDKWRNHPRVKVLHRPNREGYKGGALAYALQNTNPKAEFMIVFDADFIPYPDTITQFLKYFQVINGNLKPETIKKSRVAAVQGYQWHVLNKSENWITRGVRTEYSGGYVVERSGEEIYAGLKQIAGSVYMAKIDAVREIGWGTSITEDFELTLKLYEAGYKVAFTPYIQAPAEAVSTIKRLVRQRMRWAEGHSFNMKKMFWRLIKSKNLTKAEKFETVYLFPYYLQSFFFIIGTLSWFLAEVVFQAGLPFWTSTWGWSLVFTNLFALPLLNMVGLFLEESNEKDYLGLLSFIALSYIVAPFQGYAAVKGFLEKEEGPWFRTPKTGRITDVFSRGKFYRFVSGIFGNKAVNHLSAIAGHSSIEGVEDLYGQTEEYGDPSLVDQLKALFPGMHGANPYLALATANNQFNKFRIERKKIKGIVNLTIVVLLLTSVVLSAVAIPLMTVSASGSAYWFHNSLSDLTASTAANPRINMRNDAVGAADTTVDINSTTTDFYVLTDNLNKQFTADKSFSTANSTGDKRNGDIATLGSDGTTVAVWEDSRNSQSANDTFTATTGFLNSSRNLHAATLLQNGRVLVTGGTNTAGGNNLSGAELYDPATGKYTVTTGFMNSAHIEHTSTLLNNGKVLITGGELSSRLSNAELYDPSAQTFTNTTGFMRSARAQHAASLLNNGKVLITGGFVGGSNILSEAEVFDPLTQRFTGTTGFMRSGRYNHTSTLLQNGRVLIAGGNNGADLSQALLYDPVAQTFSVTQGFMASPRELHAATLLNNGKVLITGGSGDGGTTDMSGAELFDPAEQTFTPTGNFLSTPRGFHTSTLLNNGKVLIAGGRTDANWVSSAEIYDPSTNTFTATTGFMTAAFGGHTATLLNNGQVLINGGSSSGTETSESQLYTPRTYDVYAQKYDKSGTPQWGADIKVNSDSGNRTTQTGTPSNYDHLNPKVRLDSSGNAIVAWQEARNSVYGDDVYAQKLQSSDGAKLWPAASSSTDKFTATSNSLAVERDKHSVVLMPNGKVLVVAGLNSGTSAGSSSEVYDPSADTFSTTGFLNVSRHSQTATLLNSGLVLVAGGVAANPLSSGELYNPVTGTFTNTGNLNSPRWTHAAVMLQSGKVLIAGGCTVGSCTTATSTAELYDPSAGTFSSVVGPMSQARQYLYKAAVMLENGNVLITGGTTAAFSNFSSAEIYSPITNTFTQPTNNMAVGRILHTATLLNNGKVLVAGGNTTPTSTADLYDPSTNTFSAAAGMNTPRAGHSATLLNNGKVLVAGGCSVGNCTTITSTAELYDPSTNTWTLTGGSLPVTPRMHSASLLNSGKVLIVGGCISGNCTTYSSSAETYLSATDMEVSNDGSPANGTGLPRPEHPDNGKGILGEQKTPAVGVDTQDNAVVAWASNKEGSMQNWDLVFPSTASQVWNQTNINMGAEFGCNGGGGTNSSCGADPILDSTPLRIKAQKLASTTGLKNWGTTSSNYVNAPADTIISTTGDANSSPAITTDLQTHTIIAWDSSGAEASGIAGKVKNIYAQELNSNGGSTWGGSYTATTGFINGARNQHTATLLDNGKVFLTGGCTGSCDSTPANAITTGSIYDPSTGLFSATAGLRSKRYRHTATYMNFNSKVLVVGGCPGPCPTSTGQVYDPVANSWAGQVITAVRTGRMNHTATQLNTGKILVAGGCSIGTGSTCTGYTSTAQLYDPNANSFAATGMMRTNVGRHTATLLNTGKVLIAGGCSGASECATVFSIAETFDPQAATFTQTTSMSPAGTKLMNAARHSHTATLLNNGQVLIAGGCSDTGSACSTALSSAELFDPLTNNFNAISAGMNTTRAFHTAVLLNNGKVLIAGGCNGVNCMTTSTNMLSTSELYDPIAQTFTLANCCMTGARDYFTATLLTSGKVLMAGGHTTAVSTAELYSTDQLINTIGVSDNAYPTITYETKNSKVYYGWQGFRGSGQGGGGYSADSDRGGGTYKIYGQKSDNPTSGALTKNWPAGTADSFTATTGFLSSARYQHTATLLNDGTVLLAGGRNSATNHLSSAETYDPSSDTFTTTGFMSTTRSFFASVMLNNGKVLMVGGSDNVNNHSSSEVYDPVTRLFTTTGFMANKRDEFTATLLNTGKVLIAGGWTGAAVLTGAELYDPVAGTFSATGNNLTSPRNVHTATLLQDGRVLVVGGSPGTGQNSTAELYDPVANTFKTTTGFLSSARDDFTATLLNNGKVLIVGGENAGGAISSAELYDPATQLFTQTTGFLNVSGRLRHTATLLPSGKVLIALGTNLATTLTLGEVYDPVKGTFSTSIPPVGGLERKGATATLLNTGNVLLSGGCDAVDLPCTTTPSYYSSALLYNPAGELQLSHDFGMAGNQTAPSIALNGVNPVVVWQDNRTALSTSSPTTTTNDSNVFMQTFNTSGAPQWPAASTASGFSSPYAAMDIRADTYNGSKSGNVGSGTGTHYSGKPKIGGNTTSVLSDGTSRIFIGFEDNRNDTAASSPTCGYSNSSSLVNNCLQSYDMNEQDLATTTWTVFFHGSLLTSESLNINSDITEWDGVQLTKTALTSWSACSPACPSMQSVNYTTGGSNPPPSDTVHNATMRRLRVRFARSSANANDHVTITYDNSSPKDSRLEIGGTVVPEKSIFLSLLAPILPPAVLVFSSRRRKYVKIERLIK